jgi:hypothetical protein
MPNHGSTRWPRASPSTPAHCFPHSTAARIDWKRITVFFNHTVGWMENNTDGPFTPPPAGTLLEEWGPAGQDVRHRVNLTVNNQIVRNLLLSFNVNGSSGAPYSIRTGFDDNGDLIFNDRPLGVDRNSLRGASQWSINPAMAYTFTFGRNITSLPPGVGVIANGAAPTVVSVDQSGARFPPAAVRAGAEHHQSLELWRLQRHAHVAVLRAPDIGQPASEDRFRSQLQFLIRGRL